MFVYSPYLYNHFILSCANLYSNFKQIIIILCGIKVKGEYGWRRFVMDGRRGFTNYSTVVPLGEWRSGFRVYERANGWRRSSNRPWLQRPVSR
ncbi:hypothetical protein Hanom_Chr02g00152791 [Helianthus anomalus]